MIVSVLTVTASGWPCSSSAVATLRCLLVGQWYEREAGLGITRPVCQPHSCGFEALAVAGVLLLLPLLLWRRLLCLLLSLPLMLFVAMSIVPASVASARRCRTVVCLDHLHGGVVVDQHPDRLFRLPPHQ